jgi:hypothetical protein
MLGFTLTEGVGLLALRRWFEFYSLNIKNYIYTIYIFFSSNFCVIVPIVKFIFIVGCYYWLNKNNIVFAMEQENNINLLLLAKEAGNDLEVNRILNQLRNVNDPIQALQIANLIQELANQRGIILDNIFINQNQGITIANEGTPPTTRPLRSILEALGLFIGLVYLVISFIEIWVLLENFCLI